jgi:hypothetical protein
MTVMASFYNIARSSPRRCRFRSRRRVDPSVKSAAELAPWPENANRRHLRNGRRRQGLVLLVLPTKHDLFAELVRSMRQRLRRAPPYFALLQVERTEQHLSATLREGSDVYLRDVVAHIGEAQRDRQIADTDPTLLALGVLGAVSSFSNAWRNGRIELSADELATFVGDWVVRALSN